MEQIPTIKDFFKLSEESDRLKFNEFIYEKTRRLIIMHVEAALKAANRSARIIDDPNSYCGNTGSEYLPDQIVCENSILKAYPLSNIK